MIQFSELAAELKRNAIGHLNKVLEMGQKVDIGLPVDLPEEDEDPYENDLYDYYMDDGHYTSYRLLSVYKDDEGVFVTGVEDWNNDTMEFNVQGMDIALLCEIVDKVKEKLYDN